MLNLLTVMFGCFVGPFWWGMYLRGVLFICYFVFTFCILLLVLVIIGGSGVGCTVVHWFVLVVMWVLCLVGVLRVTIGCTVVHWFVGLLVVYLLVMVLFGVG